MTTSLTTHTPEGRLLAPQLDYILLDGSGSMHSKWWDSLAAIDDYIDVLKRANLNAHCILTTFCSQNIAVIQRDTPLRNWQPLSQDPIGAFWGGTPLYDAINALGRHIRDLSPASAHIIIVTDGQETSSATTHTQAKSILDWLRAKGYQVTFLGCDFNNNSQAALLGATAASCIGVQKHLMSDATRNLAEKRLRHARTGTPIHFTEGERTQFGGHLNAPEPHNETVA